MFWKSFCATWSHLGRSMLQLMVQELTATVSRAQLLWKESSLEWISAGSLTEIPSEAVSVEQAGKLLVYQQVHRLCLIGDVFDAAADTNQSVLNRRSSADALFYKHLKTLKPAGPVRPRLEAWHDSAAPRAIYGVAAWHLTAGILRSVAPGNRNACAECSKCEEALRNRNVRTTIARQS